MAEKRFASKRAVATLSVKRPRRSEFSDSSRISPLRARARSRGSVDDAVTTPLHFRAAYLRFSRIEASVRLRVLRLAVFCKTEAALCVSEVRRRVSARDYS